MHISYLTIQDPAECHEQMLDKLTRIIQAIRQYITIAVLCLILKPQSNKALRNELHGLLSHFLGYKHLRTSLMQGRIEKM